MNGVTPIANPAMFIIFRDGDNWGLQQKLDGLVVASGLDNFQVVQLFHFLHGGRAVIIETIGEMLEP